MKINVWLTIAVSILFFSSCSFASEDGVVPSGEVIDGVRVINVTAYKYGFDPDPIIVKYSEKVRLVVTSKDVTHGFGVKEMGINTAVPAGKEKDIEFTADKKGEFHIHCTVYCGPGHGGMHGTLKVIE